MNTDVEGLNSITADLAKLDRQILPRARVVTQKTCADTKTDAQAFAPVDTGFLRNSIGYETHLTATAVSGEVGPTANYGEFVELGTSRNAPAAYMGPAFDRRAPAYEQAMGKIIDEVLR